MSKITALVLFFLVLAGSVSAQLPKWVLVSEDLGGMADMVFTSHDTGYFFGGHTMQRTTDSGGHITPLDLPHNATGTASNMSWSDNNTGFLAFSTSSHPLLVRTTDAGNTWDTVVIKLSNKDTSLDIGKISFPTTQVGYATGGIRDGSGNDTGYFIAKTSNRGATWTIIKESSSHTFGLVQFRDANYGLILDLDAALNSYFVDAIYDGQTVVVTKKAVGVATESPNFLLMNQDGSWIVGLAGLNRSTDSGKTWTQTLKNGPSVYRDPNTGIGSGEIYTACFNGPRGLAFEDLGATFFACTDGGVQWLAGTTAPGLPGQRDTIQPVASSFPAPTIAYVLGIDSITSSGVLLKIDLPAPPPSQGVAAASPVQDQFTASVTGQTISFTAPPVVEARSIIIMDLLGRPCAEVQLTSNAETARLASSALVPGTYFARLGNACAKFTIWN